jgi:poly-gamma-glutamate synthesis protein (capsule biosynthesis protein)
VRVGLLGDVMLGRAVGGLVADGVPPEDLWGADVRVLCSSLDCVVVNLECALSSVGRATDLIPEKPFFFRGPPSAVRALSAIGVRAASLANNHVLDFGEVAARDTVDVLARSGIAAVGAGADRSHARRGVVVTAGDGVLGVIAVTDHPSEYEAGERSWGTAYAPLGTGAPGWLLDAVADLRSRSDAVVAFPHWGFNMTSEPEPWQLEVADELRRAGADLVAGHSSHAFHGAAWGALGPVLPDLGGALDDYLVDPVLNNDLGLLAIWHPGGEPPLELVGLRIDHGRTRLAVGEDASWIAERLLEASSALGARVVCNRTATGGVSATVAGPR